MLVRRMYFAGSMLLLPLGASALAQTVVVGPTPVPAQSQVYVAPTAPPPPRVETVPPPPSEAARVMYWRPGHWMWDGASWSWAQGQYVERPAPQAVWEPGHWAQQPTGGYVWVDGRWQG
jgi:hypothetical protein